MMKPEKKHGIYWSCGLGHNHRTKHGAQQCIDQQKRSKKYREKREREDKINKPRDIDITKRWALGEPLETIGKDVNLTRNRISQIKQKVLGLSYEILKRSEPPYKQPKGRINPKNRDFFFEQINAVARHWGIDENGKWIKIIRYRRRVEDQRSCVDTCLWNIYYDRDPIVSAKHVLEEAQKLLDYSIELEKIEKAVLQRK